jgi:hypothetical protein
VRAPGSGNDGAQPSAHSALGIGKHVIGHAVGRNHPRFVADAKLLENLDCVLHGVPVGAGAHDDADLNISHAFKMLGAALNGLFRHVSAFYFFALSDPK